MAVIDLGSNSWRLVVYMFVPGDWWKLTDEIYETVRIGAGLAETGRLGDAAMGRGLETLAVFERFLAAHGLGPDAVHAVATSAIRDAANGEMFLKAARAASGLNIEVISDEDEARFGYVAAINSSTMTDGIVLETGGGSIQVIEVADRHAKSLQSFPLGAVRMTEQFLPGSGPARKRDIQRLRAHVREALSGLPALAAGGDRIVGMGGAVRNLAAAAQRMADQPDIGVQGFVITPRDARRPRPDAGGAAGGRARRVPGDQGRARRHHPRLRDGDRDRGRAGLVRRHRGHRGQPPRRRVHRA